MKNFLKLILVIAITLGYLFGTAALMERYYRFLYGKDTVFYTGNRSFAVQALAFLIFLGAMAYFWSKDGLKDWSWDSDDGIQSVQNTKQKVIMTAVLAAALLTVNLICIHWYHRITPDGVEIHRPFSTKNYTWDDVEYYTLDTHAMDDTLSMKMVMKDGKKPELLPSVLYTESAGFLTEYKDGVYDFLPWLNKKLIEKNKPLRIEDRKKLLRRLQKYKVWADLAKELIEACEAAGTFR